MEVLTNSVNAGMTGEALSGAIPNVGGILITLVIFGIGFYFLRRVMGGAGKAKAKI